jgi:hypothetical protein
MDALPYKLQSVTEHTTALYLWLSIYVTQTAVEFSVLCSVKMGMLFKTRKVYVW